MQSVNTFQADLLFSYGDANITNSALENIKGSS